MSNSQHDGSTPAKNSRMYMEWQVDPPAWRVHLFGKMGLSLCAEFRDLGQLTSDVILDFKRVRELEFSFISMISHLQEQLFPNNHVHICNASPQQQKLLEVAQLNGPIRIAGLKTSAISKTRFASSREKLAQLSSEELDFVRWLSFGLRDEEVASRSGLQLQEVVRLERDLSLRLGFRSTAELVKLWVGECKSSVSHPEKELRQESRFRWLAYLRLEDHVNGKSLGRLIDSSSHGLRTVSDRPQRNRPMKLKIPVAVAGIDSVIEAQGQALWTRALPKWNAYETGYAIHSISTGQQRRHFEQLLATVAIEV